MTARAWLFGWLVCASAVSAEPPHEHTGKLPPYQGEPPEVSLTDKQQARVAQNRPVYSFHQLAGARRGVVVFKVEAPPSVVWSVIRDFKSYPSWIDELGSTHIYKRQNEHTYVEFKARHWLMGDTRWFARHDYPAPDSTRTWGSWTLDYARRSDIDDTVGFWRVQAVPGEAGSSIVTYSTDVQFSIWLPRLVRNRVVRRGLRQATEWVKQQVEARVPAN